MLKIAFILCLCALAVGAFAEEGASVSHVIDSIPTGYNLYDYDDCGVIGHQPHVVMQDCYVWTFNTSDTDADERSRSSVFSYKPLKMVYENLDPKLSYVLALTYSTDHVYKRVQSLWADGIELHGPRALPNGKADKVIVQVPESVTSDGKMNLEIRIHGEVNATVAIVELWASGKPEKPLRFGPVAAVSSEISGKIYDLYYNGVEGASISLIAADSDKVLATAVTGKNGAYNFEKSSLGKAAQKKDLQLTASLEGKTMSTTLSASEQVFDPVRYRPRPSKVAGLKNDSVLLDGKWRINTNYSEKLREEPLASAGWGDFKVPGQWLQQGYDVPYDKTAAVAKEFTVPKEWKDYRIFLRFDSIHAGTNYYLNGKKLGYSENLFTPVEWDITDVSKFGEANRLDLDMKVDTASERLSYATGYAFHSLGGIDRSVHIYALPKTHIKDFRLLTDLDKSYRDATLDLQMTLDNASGGTNKGMQVYLSLTDPNGKPVELSNSMLPIDSLSPGDKPASIKSSVKNPLKWTAETPNLYKLAIDLKDGDKLIERVERSIGFRKIEIKGSQLYVNGTRVKLIGACHHELDPLTGRADTARFAEEDVRLLKEANFNYIRTSHYPPNIELVDAADRLGMYVEVEAPFCWVAPTDDLTDLRAVLTPTSAMIDYYHTHASVIVWSIANESHFNHYFAESNRMIKELDPTRPTMFNHPMSENENSKLADICNYHYIPMPYDEQLKDYTKPIFLGEFFFPLCHDQTDVLIDPGLRELWGFGHADPTSDWAKTCNASFDDKLLQPGGRPGAWEHMYNSNRYIGGAIWAALDEPFYLPNGKHAGYAWVHGFWGMLDGWRRPKTEWYLSRYIFSPVWFPKRQVEFKPGQKSIKIPVENRYAFTDLKNLKFEWSIGSKHGTVKASLPPAKTGEIEISVPTGTAEGEKILLKVTSASGMLINEIQIHLGKEKPVELPTASAGAPKCQDDGKNIVIEGASFTLVLDKKTGDFNTADPRHSAPVTHFPSVHATRIDYGDLGPPNSKPYEVLPDAKTRVVDDVSVKEQGSALAITVKDHYNGFAGSVTWLIDKNGVGKISSDYIYSGEDLAAREIGIKLMLRPDCRELKWKRWSEWDVFPEESICRTEGTATAFRPGTTGPDKEGIRPGWTWSKDQTELGTSDFRGIKFNIYNAALSAPDGSGAAVYAKADAHTRSCVTEGGVALHILSGCRLGAIQIKNGDHIKGEYVVELKQKAP